MRDSLAMTTRTTAVAVWACAGGSDPVAIKEEKGVLIYWEQINIVRCIVARKRKRLQHGSRMKTHRFQRSGRDPHVAFSSTPQIFE